MTLVAPPKNERPSRVVLRILALVVMLAVVGVVIWAAVNNQNIGIAETVVQQELEVASPAVYRGDVFNVVHHGLGSPQVVLLHDVDVAGSVMWEGVIDELGVDVSVLTVDLPGYGLSARYPEQGPEHTVSGMAEMVSAVVASRFTDRAVIFAGVGLGAEVAAEIAVTRPEMVSGLVMVDVDFYGNGGIIRALERWPFFGTAFTHAFHGGGAWYDRYWAPHCADGGWCPSRDQVRARNRATTIIGTNASLRAFWLTPASSLVPSLIDDIVAPTTLIWSRDGEVPESSIDRVREAMAGIEVVEVEAWKAHLEDPRLVADAILAYG
jgi:pimeloyl-ACP methyl ester carboxylesterase